MNARLQANVIRSRLVSVPANKAVGRAAIGGAALENFDRYAYQSARCRDGNVAPLPLTLAEAWAEAERMNPQGETK